MMPDDERFDWAEWRSAAMGSVGAEWQGYFPDPVPDLPIDPSAPAQPHRVAKQTLKSSRSASVSRVEAGINWRLRRDHSPSWWADLDDGLTAEIAMNTDPVVLTETAYFWETLWEGEPVNGGFTESFADAAAKVAAEMHSLGLGTGGEDDD